MSAPSSRPTGPRARRPMADTDLPALPQGGGPHAQRPLLERLRDEANALRADVRVLGDRIGLLSQRVRHRRAG